MVKLRDISCFEEASAVSVEPWINHVGKHLNDEGRKRIHNVCMQLLDWHEHRDVPLQALQQGAHMAQILADLKLDANTLCAALIFPSYRQLLTHKTMPEFDQQFVKLMTGVIRMDAVESLQSNDLEPEQYAHHIDNLRQMLLAMVEDVRVVLIKLADLICLLEQSKDCSLEDQIKYATQAREIYAPLANRLGVGQIKWQLEDLAFRFLEPERYKQVAKFISEKRADRQKSITEVITALEQALKEDGIHATVYGRVKHIYSIYRKMQRKQINYDEVYDVRAVRVIVDKIPDCYAALGTVHRLWRHIPKEFDDYIAQPKSNGYRSLHTAVVGPMGKALEVQIRTQEMHEVSELGVCAHWAYKEGEGIDPAIQNKVKWLRTLLEWQEEVSTDDDFITELQNNVTEERVYVFTPKGEVLDFPRGSTPLDFAYHIHTDIGHRTRGAKANGRIVPLTYVLTTGDRVEILTGSESRPGRDWLNPDTGYIYTSRARAKVRAWFKQQNRDENMAQGRAIMERECEKLNLPPIDYLKIAPRFNMKTADDIFAAVGRGDLRPAVVIYAGYGPLPDPEVTADEILSRKHVLAKPRSTDITIQGVGNLLTIIAGCCQPLPGEEVIGFITQGRGVAVHRKDCQNILQSERETPERIIQVDWGHADHKTYSIRVTIHSYDRKNLLRDMTSVLSHEQVNVTAIESHTNSNTNTVLTHMTLEIEDLAKLGRVLERLQALPNVISAVRD